MLRWCILLSALAACSARQPQPLSHTMLVPQPLRGCPPPAIDPKPLPPIRTADQLKRWAFDTAHARDIDKLALQECSRRLDQAVDALERVRAEVDEHSSGGQ